MAQTEGLSAQQRLSVESYARAGKFFADATATAVGDSHVMIIFAAATPFFDENGDNPVEIQAVVTLPKDCFKELISTGSRLISSFKDEQP